MSSVSTEGSDVGLVYLLFSTLKYIKKTSNLTIGRKNYTQWCRVLIRPISRVSPLLGSIEKPQEVIGREYFLCCMYCAEFNNYSWTKTYITRTTFFFSHKVPWTLINKATVGQCLKIVRSKTEIKVLYPIPLVCLLFYFLPPLSSSPLPFFFLILSKEKPPMS